MTAYTAATGNTNDPTIFTPNGTPTSSDTVSINAGATLTVPAGTTFNPGAVTCGGSGCTLDVFGTYSLGGNLTLGASATIKLEQDAILDLNGHTIQPGTNNTYTFIGASGHRWTIQNTGASTAGQFLSPGTSPLSADLEYGIVKDTGACVFARTHTSAETPTYKNVLFTNTGNIWIDETGTSANAGLIWENCDVRTPRASAYVPVMLQNNAPNAGVNRYFRASTWYNSGDGTIGGSQVGQFRFNSNGLVVESTCVFSNFGVEFSANMPSAVGGFWHKLKDNYVANAQNPTDGFSLTAVYCFYEGGDHPWPLSGTTTISGSAVFEGTPPIAQGGTGTNWILCPASSAGKTLTVKDALWLGEGNPIVVVAATNWNFLCFNNTTCLNNYGLLGGSTYFATLFFTEQTGFLSGNVQFYNNLVVRLDTSTANDSFIDLIDGTGGQIDVMDYNAGWGYPAGPYTPPIFYTANALSGAPANSGSHDKAFDPLFIDRTRKLAAWDSLLGGPGTSANAISELLKRNGYDSSGSAASWNSNYNVPNLIAWVREGFTPRNPKANAGNGSYFGGIKPYPVNLPPPLH